MGGLGATFVGSGKASRSRRNAVRQGNAHDFDDCDQTGRQRTDLAASYAAHRISVALLTGGSDRPYVFGLTTSLGSIGVDQDLIGSDELNSPEFHAISGMKFLNLRGDQRPDVSLAKKIFRVLRYYARLIRYAATARPRIFHILWNNKFEYFDRTLLMFYYKLLGKRIVITAHNVNAGRRDSNDTFLNRLTLGIQYRSSDHIFVHTEKMKRELLGEFGVPASRITVIPFGINNSVPVTCLTTGDARQRLGIRHGEKVILFFGRITPYKGLEYLIGAFREILARGENYRLIVAGRPDNCDAYWRGIRETIVEDEQRCRVLVRADFIPDEETEIYFKAADVLVLPYKEIYQSGVLFLGHSFGLPVLAADVGSLKDDIDAGETGFLFNPKDPVDLAKAIERYFASDLYADLSNRRREIRAYATERHSWDVVSQVTMSVYAGLLRMASPNKC